MRTRWTMMWVLVGALPGLLGTSGCKDDDAGGPAELENPPSDLPPATIDPQDMQQIESVSGASAPQVFNIGYIGVLLASVESGEVCSTVDGVEMCMPLGNGCPALTETSDGFVIEGGGCTTDDGDVWSGRVVAKGVFLSEDGDVSPPGASATIAYDDLTIEQVSDCEGATSPNELVLNGVLEIIPEADEAFDFDLALEISATGVGDDCTELQVVSGGYEYSGSRRTSGGQQIWNGSGVLGNSESGAYEAETIDEVLDSSVCQYEAVSGTTTIKAGSDVAVVTYDGATDCNENSTVTWTFNGADQGTIEGVRCHVARGSLGAFGWGGLLVVVLFGARRRRRG